jgi:hypothetical protein
MRGQNPSTICVKMSTPDVQPERRIHSQTNGRYRIAASSASTVFGVVCCAPMPAPMTLTLIRGPPRTSRPQGFLTRGLAAPGLQVIPASVDYRFDRFLGIP